MFWWEMLFVGFEVLHGEYDLGLVYDNEMVDACECGNEPSGSMKCREFLD